MMRAARSAARTEAESLAALRPFGVGVPLRCGAVFVMAAQKGPLALILAGCGRGHELPDMHAEPGGFQNMARFSTPEMLEMCGAMNDADATGQLASMSDKQIANGVCEMSAISLELIGRGADPDQVCVRATWAAMSEFDGRFPGHDPKEVIGRC